MVLAATVESTAPAVVVVVLGASVGMALVGPATKVVVGDAAAAERGKASDEQIWVRISSQINRSKTDKDVARGRAGEAENRWPEGAHHMRLQRKQRKAEQ